MKIPRISLASGKSIRYRLRERWIVWLELRQARFREGLELASRALCVSPSVFQFVGYGGSSVVFRAPNVEFGEVAVKIPRYGQRESGEFGGAEASLRREGQVLAAIGSSEFLPRQVIIDVSGRFLVREYVSGPTLKDATIRPSRPLRTVHDLLALARSLFPRIHDAPEGQFVIRDLKPSNIIRTEPTDRLVLVDLGGVRRAGECAVLDGGRRLGSGKWLFWAPEQLLAGPAVGPAADYFALGACAFFVLLGRPPFSNSRAVHCDARKAYLTEYAVASRQLRASASLLGLDSWLVSFIDSCLDPRVEQRPMSLPPANEGGWER